MKIELNKFYETRNGFIIYITEFRKTHPSNKEEMFVGWYRGGGYAFWDENGLWDSNKNPSEYDLVKLVEEEMI